MRRFGRLGWLLAGGVWLFVPVAFRAAQHPSATAGYSTNPSDKAECERQLNIIYGAIQQYRSEHDNQYPNKLSDLTKDFIHDRNVLVCPFVRSRGGLRTWKKDFREVSPDAGTSYSYEFAPVPVD